MTIRGADGCPTLSCSECLFPACDGYLVRRIKASAPIVELNGIKVHARPIVGDPTCWAKRMVEDSKSASVMTLLNRRATCHFTKRAIDKGRVRKVIDLKGRQPMWPTGTDRLSSVLRGESSEAENDGVSRCSCHVGALVGAVLYITASHEP